MVEKDEYDEEGEEANDEEENEGVDGTQEDEGTKFSSVLAE